ncbi:MAG: SpoIIE family protein phosphatase, partial [Oscillospiraceae bacterium]|nr:SpoIIE family protein phosphatase [Oscillospiraceae bacterium]
MAYEPMEVLPWTVVTVMDVAEALSPAAATRSGIEAMTARTVADVNHSIRGVTLAVIVVLALSVLAVVVLSAVLAGRITRPLGRLLEGVGRISGGDLDAQITVETRDEIASLAHAFNAMTGSLKKHIAELTAVTAEKERIGAELNVATDIQASMLPSIFPAFPERSEFDIYATMVPAKEVGGDFYDFFMVDDEQLGIVMADVSGKGVPAALFMVIAKTLIKNHAQNGELPQDVFTNVNDQLCESNDAGMFVTGWMAVLNIRTGDLTYANAGQNPPLLRRADGG